MGGRRWKDDEASGLGRAIQWRESHQITAAADQVPGSAAEGPGAADRLVGRQAPPAPAMEPVGVDDFDSLPGVDRLAAVGAFVDADTARSPRERGGLTPAARASLGAATERRGIGDRGRDEAHFREAHRTGEGQAGVAQGFPWALLEQSAHGGRELRAETLGQPAVQRQVGTTTKSGVSEVGAAGARSSPPASPAPASPPRP